MLEYKVPRLVCETKDFVVQNDSFWVLKRVVSHCKVSRFRFQSKSFYKTDPKNTPLRQPFLPPITCHLTPPKHGPGPKFLILKGVNSVSKT